MKGRWLQISVRPEEDTDGHAAVQKHKTWAGFFPGFIALFHAPFLVVPP